MVDVTGLNKSRIKKAVGIRLDWFAAYVGSALAPARVSKVEVVSSDTRSAKVIVPDYQLSLAIGKDGQNARLAARLTGWRIDIHSDATPSE